MWKLPCPVTHEPCQRLVCPNKALHTCVRLTLTFKLKHDCTRHMLMLESWHGGHCNLLERQKNKTKPNTQSIRCLHCEWMGSTLITPQQCCKEFVILDWGFENQPCASCCMLYLTALHICPVCVCVSAGGGRSLLTLSSPCLVSPTGERSYWTFVSLVGFACFSQSVAASLWG